MAFIDVYLISILMAFLASCALYFQKKISLALYFFPPFLLLAFFVEVIGMWTWYRRINNQWLYIIFTTIEFIYYCWLISEVVEMPSVKKILYHFMWVYPVLIAINKMLLQKSMDKYPNISFSLSCLGIACATMLYFGGLFKSNHYINLIRNPFFWICSGLLFFYTCSFFGFTISNICYSLYSASPSVIKNYNTVVSLLNILLYSSFIIASLCRIKIRKFSS